MKIALNHGGPDPYLQQKQQQARQLESMILSVKKGDWNAKTALAQHFQPLLHSLARKRASTPKEINEYIERGREGLFKAARKYSAKVGPERFQIFALDFVESAMDNRRVGFFARLFGRQ